MSIPIVFPSLDPADIHVWRLRFDSISDDQTVLAEYLECLPPDERRRAQRYSHSGSRNTFIRTRASLRRLLGHYLQVSPRDIVLVRNPHGKLRLADTEENEGLVFNVAHSGDVTLLGIGMETPIGVDVEKVRPRRGLDRLAEHCLTATELDRWTSGSAEQRSRQFMHYWTAKEAFSKAVGRGIAIGLTGIEIGEDFRGFTSVPAGYEACARWSLQTWDAEDYCVALVYGKPQRRLLYLEVDLKFTP